MTARDAAELVTLLREAILWAKILSGLAAFIGLPLLLWALEVSRSLDAIKSWQGKHDDTLHDLSRVGDSFAGTFKALRKVETILLRLAWGKRGPRE